jgi:formylglycine-generating enzyme required for sulfatase activity
MYAKFYKSKNPKRFHRAIWLAKRRIFAHHPTLAAAPSLWADSRSIGRPRGVDFDITACCAPAVPGETWRVLKDGIRERSVSLPNDMRWRCVKDLLIATAVLEQLGVVHGDLSDNNVVIDVNAPAHSPALRLIDFDAYVSKDAPHLTLSVQEGGSYGTEGYCPPDLAQRFDAGDRSVAPCSDRYGRDMLLFELLLYCQSYSHEAPPVTWGRNAHVAKLCEAAKACCPRPDLYTLVRHLQVPSVFDQPETDRPSSLDLLRQAGIPVPTPAAPLHGLAVRLPDLRKHTQLAFSAVKVRVAACSAEIARLAHMKNRITAKSRICVAVLVAVFLMMSGFRLGQHHPPARLLAHHQTVSESPTWQPKSVNQPTAPASQRSSPTALEVETVPVEPGSFQMGSNDGESDEQPVHTVRISQPFRIGKYEITQAQYESLTGMNPSDSKGPDLPVNNVSWGEAVAFCQRLTDREQRAGRLPAGYIYRLPTEAEWEYAARGGVRSRGFEYAGSDNPDEVAWYGENDLWELHPVGRKKPNELGLYDMSGNVGEWCHDWYDPGYYDCSPASDPSGPSLSEARVVRGGHRHCSSAFCRSTNRGWSAPTAPVIVMGHGFRVVIARPELPAESSHGLVPTP